LQHELGTLERIVKRWRRERLWRGYIPSIS